jgi:protein tyrosine phosphatase (PTP) superfamily phosphohydrolase (DUF442 family)
MASLTDLKNYIAMPDGSGSGVVGTSGQPTREQFVLIRDAGYTSVINLAMPDSDGALADERDIVSALGMQYVHIPVPFDNPTAAHLREFIAAMRSLQTGRVWVHCAVNARVSAFMYQYLRLEKGVADADARNALLSRWEPKMDAAWKRFMSIDGVES